MKLNDKSKRIIKKIAAETRLPKESVKQRIKEWAGADLTTQRFLDTYQGHIKRFTVNTARLERFNGKRGGYALHRRDP